MATTIATPIEKIRNIGIVAHIDAGKTTTTERILYYTGESHRMGNVDDGTTTTDFDPEEAQRGITIYSAAISCRWKDVFINLIDTPGHVDFTAEVERSLRVLDGACVVFSAVEGVEAQSETVWRQANKYNVPRICFINKMDRIGASFERVLQQMERRLNAVPLPLFIPMGASTTFKGIIDLIQRKSMYFDEASLGKKIEITDVPEEFKDAVDEWRGKLIESVAVLDDSAMEMYLTDGDLPVDVIHSLLRKATLAGKVQPTFCGTSLHYCGVQPLLDGVVEFLPSPLDRPPVEGENPTARKQTELRLTRKPDPEEPFAGLVFKIQADKHADLCWVRVYSGVLKSGSRLLNPRTGKKELISQLWHIQADAREKIETDFVGPGGIAGVVGPKEVVTGDTLCDQKHGILLESIVFPETVISVAVEPETSDDRKKLEEALARLAKQDPTFRAKVSEETGQTIISGMGELHLEVLQKRLQRDFNLNVKVHKPRVSYRETVRSAATGEGEFHRAVQGVVQRFGVKVRVEPFEGKEPISVASELKHDALPLDVTKIVSQAVLEAAQAGGVVGYPLMHVKFTVVSVDYVPGESTEEAIRTAVSQAVYATLGKADVGLLEPIMKLEVLTPSEFMGNVQADLNQRHARIIGAEPRDHLTALEAEAPLSRMFGYSTQVRSLSQGRASYSMEPLKYDFAPQSVLDEMMGR